jgi:hypothetical protein
MPKDGVRRRFHALLNDQRVHMILDSDRYAASSPIEFKEDWSQVRFRLESDNPMNHSTTLRVSGLPAGSYVLQIGQKAVSKFTMSENVESRVEVPVDAGTRKSTIALIRNH